MAYDMTRITNWHELSSTTGTTNNNALTAVSAKAATTTEPSTNESAGRYVIETAGPGSSGMAYGAVIWAAMPIITDANNETCGIRVWGYRAVVTGDTNTGTTLYVPAMLLDLDVTAGALTGQNNSTIENEWFFADTITIVTDNTRGGSAEVHASGTDGVSYLTFDATGHTHLEFECSRESSAAAVRVFVGAL